MKNRKKMGAWAPPLKEHPPLNQRFEVGVSADRVTPMKRVVITGMGVISPVGNNVSDFWSSLVEGKSGIGAITRFDTTDFKVKIAAEVKNFDPAEYIEDKSEIRRTDRFVQYALAAAAQAVADSGIQGKVDSSRLGVYVGSGVGGMETFCSETLKLHQRGASRVSPFFIAMMISNMAAGMVAIKHNANGPTLPVVTACASSANTVGEAFRAIKHGYADAIIAGGAESTICPLAVAGFTNCNALSESGDPERSSIPFDLERKGFVMGEGAGVLILEEMEHAISRGAKIYAEITGYGSTCDAYHITSPREDALYSGRSIELAMQEAGINCQTPLYYNAHGTGTPMNDSTETTAIKNVFGDNAYKISISSTKSMTGHMLGAAGAAEIITCALALQEGIVPPTIGYKVPDPQCDLNYTPNKALNISYQHALSASFGFGGHNACVALKKC